MVRGTCFSTPNAARRNGIRTERAIHTFGKITRVHSFCASVCVHLCACLYVLTCLILRACTRLFVDVVCIDVCGHDCVNRVCVYSHNLPIAKESSIVQKLARG